MKKMFSVNEMRTAEMHPPFKFTKKCPVMKIKGFPKTKIANCKSLLFDTLNDPGQENPLHNSIVEKKMARLMLREMKANNAPDELFHRI
jgi:hypothetical protein